MFPTDQGTYILILNLPAPTQVTIGKLGTFDLALGYYTYAGSAFGAGGLRGRLKHHLTPITRPHWHIDYLRQAAPLHEVWYTASPIVHEHPWAAHLQSLVGATIPMPRFGASDCTCPTHLLYFPSPPDFVAFCTAIDDTPQRWSVDEN